MTESPRTIVTLVHGTWARDSRWGRLEASLRATLPAPVDIRYWAWSGRNSVVARQAASERLRQQLSADRKQHPHARRIVIAHSHGGNLVAHALNNRASSGAVDQVICLSTPFLNARRRDLTAEEFRSLHGMVLVGCMFGLGAPLIFSGHEWWFVALTFPLGVFDHFRTKSRPQRVQTILGCLEQPPGFTARLIVHSPGDEALLGLFAVQVVDRIVSIWQRLYRTLFSTERALGIGLVLSGLMLGLVSVFALGQDLNGTLPPMMTWPLLALVSVMFVISALVALSAAVISICFGIPFGLSSACFMTISADPAPEGRCDYLQLPPRSTLFADFAHSRVYEDEWAIMQILDWAVSSSPGRNDPLVQDRDLEGGPTG